MIMKSKKLYMHLDDERRLQALAKRSRLKRKARTQGAVRFQDSYHGEGRYSLQAYAADGKLVSDNNISV